MAFYRVLKCLPQCNLSTMHNIYKNVSRIIQTCLSSPNLEEDISNGLLLLVQFCHQETLHTGVFCGDPQLTPTFYHCRRGLSMLKHDFLDRISNYYNNSKSWPVLYNTNLDKDKFNIQKAKLDLLNLLNNKFSDHIRWLLVLPSECS